MVDGVEVALQVGIYDVSVAFPQKLFDLSQRVLTASSRSKAVAVLGKFPIEDRLQDVAHGGLYDSVLHRRDPQRSLLGSSCFRNPGPAYRLRAVGAFLERSL